MAFTVKIIILLYVVLALIFIHEVLARPGQMGEWGTGSQRENKCFLEDQHVIEVCQRCAKQTKSNIVYPMCCEDQEDVFNWCDKYINYGKKP